MEEDSSLEPTLQSDISLLTALLAQDQSDENDPDIAELLRRLETADGVAKGVESRLDAIIGDLDSILGTLEPNEQIVVSEEVRISREGDTVTEEASRVVVREKLEPEVGADAREK
ncbi:hypothetical protein SCP_0101990 [Sparassis crispa]|uniref:Uncharacterized protein n=1 Tax=Sparassis crispa TaxID=139825 RepID=A0A401G581_9APHY|nr:hypothetical protein SCP_0101990 [Sparassis crispa]GBE77326.1 hypothetical protein SCP_0101990 [Sparassis crispa]